MFLNLPEKHKMTLDTFRPSVMTWWQEWKHKCHEIVDRKKTILFMTFIDKKSLLTQQKDFVGHKKLRQHVNFADALKKYGFDCCIRVSDVSIRVFRPFHML